MTVNDRRAVIILLVLPSAVSLQPSLYYRRGSGLVFTPRRQRNAVVRDADCQGQRPATDAAVLDVDLLGHRTIDDDLDRLPAVGALYGAGLDQHDR